MHRCNSLAPPKTDPPVGVGPTPQDIDHSSFFGGDIQPGFIPMRCHALGHRFKVFQGPTIDIPWTKQTNNSGIPTHVLEIPMDVDPFSNRMIKIVYRIGKNNQSLDVWTPEVIITNPQALEEFPSWAGNRAQKIANWLMKKFGFKLGLLELCQDFHFAAAVPKEVANAAKEIGLKSPELWWDTSRGRGELETSERKMAMALQTLPSRVTQIEDTITKGVGPTLEKLVESQNQMNEHFLRLNSFLEKLLGLSEKTPEVPVSQPDHDLGGMFG